MHQPSSQLITGYLFLHYPLLSLSFSLLLPSPINFVIKTCQSFVTVVKITTGPCQLQSLRRIYRTVAVVTMQHGDESGHVTTVMRILCCHITSSLVVNIALYYSVCHKLSSVHKLAQDCIKCLQVVRVVSMSPCSTDVKAQWSGVLTAHLRVFPQLPQANTECCLRWAQWIPPICLRVLYSLSYILLTVFCLSYHKEVKNGVFWDVTPCGSCKNRCFGGT
jgi:hypothetical protein